LFEDTAGLPAACEHTLHLRRKRTVTITISAPKLTSMTDAPGRHKSR